MKTRLVNLGANQSQSNHSCKNILIRLVIDHHRSAPNALFYKKTVFVKSSTNHIYSSNCCMKYDSCMIIMINLDKLGDYFDY